MFLQSLPMVFILAGLALYTVLGGADLGAGFWQIATRRRWNAGSIREFAHRAMGPVWEANHVWLIFVLTVFWTSYPKAFGSIMSTLAVPLFIALLGIMFRGVSYAMREGAATPLESGRIDTRFALSSILVPFALGAAVGGIATNRVPVGNAAGDMWSSWLNPTSIVIGTLAVTTSAYLAAVYLAADAAHDRELTLEPGFRLRALGSGVAAGAIAIGGLFIVNADDHALVHSLLHGRALPAVILSGFAGFATLLLVYRRRYELARYAASLAVAAIVAGWALSRWPTILPGLSVHQAAAGHDTLVCVVVAVLGGAVILFPSLALLFGLTLGGRFREDERGALREARVARANVNVRLLARLAVACLIGGFGLLNIADATWAHAIGVACLFGFIGLAFRAIVTSALDPQAAAR
ncbi:MAG TPA: cytochrome d ubiquinol oxidase subunit II [Solirubrobacteraceae bacterium]|nr:cytochrome d ubiquinol oxidase subunit II [Solirubrobacteraceae bacterium]